MFANRRPFIVVLLFVLVLSAACGGSNQPEPGVTPIVESTAVSAAPQIFVVPRETEKRLVNTEIIHQPNCDGTIETSDTVERSHSVLRTLELGSGLTVSAEGRAGVPGIGEVAVGAAVASYYQVSYGTADTLTRSVTVGAKEGTNVQYTLEHYEIWEKGELLIVAGPVSQQIPYNFRKDFSIEKLPPANIGCPGQSAPSSVDTGSGAEQAEPVQPVIGTTLPPPTSTSEPLPPTNTLAPPYCPFLTNSHIEQLRAMASVPDALRQAEAFAGHQQNDYSSGATIPAGVVIATDLQNSDLAAFPISPVKNQGGWGLFVTQESFVAPYAGTYWCIR